MPRCYFDIYNDTVTTDPEGLDLADHEAAMARALVEARVLAAESVREGRLVRDHRLEVRDTRRRHVGTVRFGEAVAIC